MGDPTPLPLPSMKILTSRTFLCTYALALLAAVTWLGCAHSKRTNPGAQHTTVPMVIEGNRPFINVTLHRSGGSNRIARCWVDSGGGGFVLSEAVARELHLDLHKHRRENGEEFAEPTEPLRASVGDMVLAVEAGEIFVAIGATNLLHSGAPGLADCLIPRSVLSRYHVILDYPNGTLTLAAPGLLKPKGTALPMPVAQGFPRTEIELDGIKYGMLLDTGASFSVVSEVTFASWKKKHPDWTAYSGAVGEASTLGGQALETMFIRGAKWGPHPLPEFGAISRRRGTFEDYMSNMMAAPVIGALGGNVLKHFRVEMDYAGQRLYLSSP